MFCLWHLFIAHKNQGPEAPARRMGRESGPHSAFSSANKPWQMLPRLCTSTAEARLAKQEPVTENFLGMAFTIHDQAHSTVSLSPRPWGWRSTGVDTHRLKHEWGPSPMNHACPEAPKPTPSSPLRSRIPPAQTSSPFPVKARSLSSGHGLDNCLSSSPLPICLETQQPNTATTTRAHHNGTRRAQSDFQSKTSELKRHRNLLNQRNYVLRRKRSYAGIVLAVELYI